MLNLRVKERIIQSNEHFDKHFNTVSTDEEIEKNALILMQLAFVMGWLVLKDIPSLQSHYPDLKIKTPTEIMQTKTCYLSYYLQKAKNMIACWPNEQEYLSLSNTCIERAKALDSILTAHAEHLGILLTFNSSLPSSPTQYLMDI
jgi:hypothetical protein